MNPFTRRYLQHFFDFLAVFFLATFLATFFFAGFFAAFFFAICIAPFKKFRWMAPQILPQTTPA